MNELKPIPGNGKILADLAAIQDSYTNETRIFIQYVEEKGLDIVSAYAPFIEHLKATGYEKNGKQYDYSASAIRKYCSGIKKRILYAFSRSEYATDLTRKAKLMEELDRVKPPKLQKKSGVDSARVLKWSEVQELVVGTQKTRIGLWIEFLSRSGLRISEARNIKLTAIKKNGAGFEHIRIMGKGSKERSVKVKGELVDRIREEFGGSTWLFEHQGKQYDRLSITNRIKAQSLRILGKQVSAHALRHSYGTEQLNRHPKKLKAISEAMGHSSISTTAIYLHQELTDEEADLSVNTQEPDKVASLESEVKALREQLSSLLSALKKNEPSEVQNVTRRMTPEENLKLQVGALGLDLQSGNVGDEKTEEAIKKAKEEDAAAKLAPPDPEEEKTILGALNQALKDIPTTRKDK